MKFRRLILSIFLLLNVQGYLFAQQNAVLSLPAPSHSGQNSLEQVLSERRSVREYSDKPMALSELAQLLWAAQGITTMDGYRSTPSAGALYPLEIYAVVKRVAEIAPGVYHYLPGTTLNEHSLENIRPEDPTGFLNQASLGQPCVNQCAVAIIITSVTGRTEKKYGTRAERYALLEAGHAAQNVLLQATALGLGAVPVGAFHDDKLKQLVKTDADPVYLLSIGKTN